MFGLGFTEILLIAVIALLFIGPDKLPDTMRQIARTFGKVKRALDDTKSTITQELQVDELRQEAMMYKQELERAKSDLSSFKNIANDNINDIKKHTQLEDSYKPTDINDDKLFDDLFEEAEKDFKALDKPKQAIKEEKIEKEITSEDNTNKDKTVSEFKHLKRDS